MSTTRPALFNAGTLDRRITLQTFATTQDEYGDVLETWADEVTLWADVQLLAGLERVQAAQTMAVMDARFIVRWRADIQPGTHRVVYDGRTYQIEAVVELGPARGPPARCALDREPDGSGGGPAARRGDRVMARPGPAGAAGRIS